MIIVLSLNNKINKDKECHMYTELNISLFFFFPSTHTHTRARAHTHTHTHKQVYCLPRPIIQIAKLSLHEKREHAAHRLYFGENITHLYTPSVVPEILPFEFLLSRFI